METYKAGQGSLARLSVWIILLLVVFLGCVELYSWIQDPKHDVSLVPLEVFRSLPLLGVPLSWKFLLCVVLFIGALWFSRRLMSRPATVDTLVEVEMEMKKVSWPTRDESMNATWVVILVTVLITFFLFTFDLLLRMVLNLFF